MELNRVLPNRGVMYVDALGIMRYYTIMQGGEDGSVILVELLHKRNENSLNDCVDKTTSYALSRMLW